MIRRSAETLKDALRETLQPNKEGPQSFDKGQFTVGIGAFEREVRLSVVTSQNTIRINRLAWWSSFD